MHYILLSWLAFTKNISKKKQNIKELYENMLKNYMNMVDDIFGNNKIDNPSVQDSLYEVMDSNKYNTKTDNNAKDVPLAEDYYKNKKQSTKIKTNIIYINKNTYNKKIIIPTGFNEKKNMHLEEKFKKIGENERLHSKGRGRKYRTKEEKEVLNKFRKFSLEKENLSLNWKDNSIRTDNGENIKDVYNTNKEVNINKIE